MQITNTLLFKIALKSPNIYILRKVADDDFPSSHRQLSKMLPCKESHLVRKAYLQVMANYHTH